MAVADREEKKKAGGWADETLVWLGALSLGTPLPTVEARLMVGCLPAALAAVSRSPVVSAFAKDINLAVAAS